MLTYRELTTIHNNLVEIVKLPAVPSMGDTGLDLTVRVMAFELDITKMSASLPSWSWSGQVVSHGGQSD